MAKKSVKSTGKTVNIKETAKPEKPDQLLPAEEVAQIISDTDSKIPPNMEVFRIGMKITMTFKGEIPNVHNTLNKYTDELRNAFRTANLPGWKAVFLANGGRYVSTL